MFNNNNDRYQYGDAMPMSFPFDQTLGNSGTTPVGYPISIGDLCWIDQTDNSVNTGLGPYCVKAADQFPWGGSLSATQVSFAQQFCGISNQCWQALVALTNVQANYGIKSGLLTVGRAGTYLMACAAGSKFGPSDLLGPDKNPASNNLLSQQVVKVLALANAVGVCVQGTVNASVVLMQLLEGGAAGLGTVQPTTTTSTTTTTTSTTTTTTTP